MRKSQIILSLISALTIGASAFGSGFKCEETSGNLKVKLYNHTSPEDGTRTPAVLVVSNDQDGTILVRKGAEIGKRNRANTVQYVVEGNRALGADQMILQVEYKEGREVLDAGDIVDAQLILVSDDTKDVRELSCERYLRD